MPTRQLDDVLGTREAFFSAGKEAIENMFPVESEAGSLSLEDLHYTGEPPSKKDEKEAIYGGKTIANPLRGRLVLRDNEGNVIDQRSRSLAKIPYMTDRGTFIYNGNDYTISNQAALRPGIYTRMSQSGKVQAPITTDGGPNMKVELDPETGELAINLHQRKIKLYPIMKAAGFDDQQIKDMWGKETFEANVEKLGNRDIKKQVKKLIGEEALGEYDTTNEAMRAVLSGYKVTPSIAKETLGEEYESVTPEALGQTASKLVSILRGDSDLSPRDSLYAQRVRTPEIQLREQIQRSGPQVSRYLWKAINRGSLDTVPSGALDDYVQSLMYDTGLATPLEEYNPLEAMDHMQRITRGGAGGLSGHAIPEESRYLSESHAGFIDPTRTPECYGTDMQVLCKEGWMDWDEVDKESEFACKVDGEVEYHHPEKMIKERYTGLVYDCDRSSLRMEVTPEHRMWVRPEDELKYKFIRLKDLKNKKKYHVDLSLDGGKGETHFYGYQLRSRFYNGNIYCAVVPGGKLYVRHNYGEEAFWCGNSINIGIDMRAARNVSVDEDGNLYSTMENPKTGELEKVNSKDLNNLTISFPDQKDEDEPLAIVGGKKQEHVPASQVDYFIPSMSEMHSDLTGLSPMLSAAHQGRALMSAKFATQAIPITGGEEPLVQARAGDGRTMESILGEKAGAMRSPAAGRVTEVRDDQVTITDNEGNEHELSIYRNFPLNRKTNLHQTLQVGRGDTVEEGDLIASSNYTTPGGTLALGTNLRTGFIPRGETFEDAMAISESAAKKLTARLLKQKEVSTEGDVAVDKGAYLADYSDKYEPEQFDKIGDDGIVRVGEEVKEGDPLILAKGSPVDNPYYYQLRKTAPRPMDESVEWDGGDTGKVMDVVKGKNGVKVFIETDEPAVQGDKLGLRHGGKGIVLVLDDEEMPRTEDGKPLELLISPLAISSRKNPGMVAEALLGKVAKKRGEPVKHAFFEKFAQEGYEPISMPLAPSSEDDEGFFEHAVNEVKKADMEPTERVFDPKQSKWIDNVLTGNLYAYRLSHTAKGKSRARSIAGHTAEGTPTQGSKTGGKKISRQPLNALLSHGATGVIEESQKLKGASNPEVWNALRMGNPIQMPEIPYANKKLFELLRGSGIDVKKKGTSLHIMPLRDSEVESRSSGEIKSSDMLRRKDMKPVAGKNALFDPSITGGPGGKKWGHVNMYYSVPNPVMERPIAKLLGIPQRGIREVLAGNREINGEVGPDAIRKSLQSIDVDRQMQYLEKNMSDMGKTKKNKALEQMKYLNTLSKYNIEPEELMISKVPVLPPSARPITDLPGLEAPVVSSSNMLYKDMIDLNNALGKSELPEEEKREWAGRLYDSVKAVYGLGKPINKKNREKNLEGILGTIFGESPKHSYLQSNVLSKAQNLSGLSVISPNNELNLNEVGMPKSLAKDIYEPLTIRILAQEGVSPVQAEKEIRNDTKRAQRALKTAVESRPVIVNRAPTLHKTGMAALWPRLTNEETLEVSPPLVGTMGGDMDGNCCKYNTPIHLKIQFGKVRTSSSGNFYSQIKKIYQEKYDEEPSGTCHIVIQIGEFPRTGEPVKDKNGADIYQVPGGVEIMTYDSEANSSYWAEIDTFTVDPPKECKKVSTRSHSVEVTNNESLFVYDTDDGEFKTIKPNDAEGKYIPILKENPSYGDYGDYDLGWFYGMYVSEGWTNRTCLGMAQNNKEIRDKFGKIAMEKMGAKEKYIHEYYDNSDNKYGESTKLHINGMSFDDFDKCLEKGDERKCFRKRLPRKIMDEGSRECLLGLLSGLIEGDGSLGWNECMKNKRLFCSFSTSSERLAQDIIRLGINLGIRARFSMYESTGKNSRDAYTLYVSIPDMRKIGNDLSFLNPETQEKWEEFLEVTDEKMVETRDLIPVSDEARQKGGSYHNWKSKEHKRWGYCRSGHCTRAKAKDILSKIPPNELTQMRKFAQNDNIHWEKIKEIEHSEPEETYDLGVPGTKVFFTADGVCLQDTMLFHVPVTEEATKDAIEKMMPTENLISPRQGESVYPATKEIALGLYLGSRKPKSDKEPKQFESKEDAIRAFTRGEMKADDPIKISIKSD